MSCSRDACFVKRISSFAQDSREGQEKRDWSEAPASRVSQVALVLPFSGTFCERRDTRCEIRDRNQVPC
jgi:hypothetical protein